MKCQKGKKCVKQSGNALPVLKGDKFCTGCDKTGKDKPMRIIDKCSDHIRKLDKKGFKKLRKEANIMFGKETEIRMPKFEKFELADHNKIDELDVYVHKVLKALGHSDALVTDESCISDFLDIFDESERTRQVQKLFIKIRVKCLPADYIWKVAERVKKLDDEKKKIKR